MKNNNLSIGTEIETINLLSSDNQYGGGWLSGLFNSSNDYGKTATNFALEAFNEKNPQVACFIMNSSLNKNHKLDFSNVDSNKRNLIHYMTMYGGSCPDCVSILQKSLKSDDAKQFINHQDIDLNTPAHYAVMSGSTNMIPLLQTGGADLSIKNKDGLHISSKNMPVKTDVVRPEPSKLFINKTNTATDDDNDVVSRLNNIVKLFKNNSKESSALSTIATDTTASYVPKANTIPQTASQTMTDHHDVLDSILKDINSQKGGKLNGTRKIPTYSNTSDLSTLSGNLSDDLLNDYLPDSDDMDNLTRQFKQKSTEAHDRAIIRIKELLGVDEKTAKAYKAIIYNIIKNEHPEMQNYDRAMELEKLASDLDYLRKISQKQVNDMIKLIESRHEEKSKSEKKEEKKEKKTKKEKKEPKEKKEKKSKKQQLIDSVTSDGFISVTSDF